MADGDYMNAKLLKSDALINKVQLSSPTREEQLASTALLIVEDGISGASHSLTKAKRKALADTNPRIMASLQHLGSIENRKKSTKRRSTKKKQQ